ncbi:hypothetical protein FRC08_014787 [Ceratobasidium sp. 394]|nr:hypothetical protein FRC08_014787 [Ceratobasidium sp. 394]KAG9097163.1 hypothetical protein FS749_006914 [Ceratobasidium sp. UAMH 11750]
MAATHGIVIVLSYLETLQDRAFVILNLIRSLLGAFELNVTTYSMRCDERMADEDVKLLEDHDSPFHFVFLFMTESDPRGGWWWEDGSRIEESVWLQEVVGVYSKIVAKSVTSRIFGLCCGVNLTSPGAVQHILDGLQGTAWGSIVLPSAAVVNAEDYAFIFPEIFVKFYYNGLPLKTSLLGVWSKSKDVREHTNLLVIENPGNEQTRTISKYTYAPLSTRPWGLHLPVARSYCMCSPHDDDVRWHRISHRIPKASKRSKRPAFGEHFVVLQASCKHTRLYIAVFQEGFETLDIGGTTIVRQDFDPSLGAFPLDMSSHVCKRLLKLTVNPAFRHKSTDPRSRADRFEHSSPWTESGKEALKAAQMTTTSMEVCE